MRVLVDEQGLRLGRGLGDRRRPPSATPTTRCMPEALERWPVELFEPRAPAPPRDHLRDQPPLPRTRCVRATRRRRRGCRACRIIEEGDAQAGAHGAPRGGRLPLGQRRGRAAHRAARKRAVPRLLRAVAGAVQQQDQRRHAAALAAAGQPRPGGAHHRAHRRRTGSPTSSSSSGSSRWPTTPASASVPRRSSRPTRSALAGDVRARARRRRSTPTRSSTCRSSASTSTSGSCSTRCTSSPLYLRIKDDRSDDLVPRTFSSAARPRPATAWPS